MRLPVFKFCLPNRGGSSLPCVLPSIMDPGGTVNFSVCLAFYLLRQSGDFQASYIQSWELEVCKFLMYLTVDLRLQAWVENDI